MDASITATLLLPVWLFSIPLNNHFDVLATSIEKTVSKHGIEEKFYQCIEKGDLLSPTGSSAYDAYRNFLVEYPTELATQRKLKRKLIAKLVESADQTLTLYFDQGGSFLVLAESNYETSMDQYYAVAAKLMGKDHYLYNNLLSKSLFAEALRHQYLGESNPDVAKTKLKKSLELDPYASYAYNELGQIYYDETDYTAACEQYRQAIKWNASWKLAQQNLQIAEAALLQSQKK